MTTQNWHVNIKEKQGHRLICSIPRLFHLRIYKLCKVVDHLLTIGEYQDVTIVAKLLKLHRELSLIDVLVICEHNLADSIFVN